MQKSFIAAVAVVLAVIFGGPAWSPVPSAAAQGVTAINPQVAALLSQYPAGGPGLRAAVARLVEAQPDLAAAVVAAAAHATPEQQSAIGAGLGDAYAFFLKIGSDSAAYAENLIRQAVTAADPVTLAAYVSVIQPTQAQPIPGGNNNVGNTTTGCISPSSPGRRC
ncbi:MAG TPA: hypothetical protein VGG57_08765 [Stellaceae bacterium]|jgi:hypothetical protein